MAMTNLGIKHIVFWLLMVFATPCVGADLIEEENNQQYPQAWDMLDYVYDDYSQAYDQVFTEEAMPYWWLVGLSTAALIALDDKLVASSQRLGRQWGLGNKDNTKPMVSAGSVDIFRAPTDTGSSLYFLGDGWLHAGIAIGFLATGAWTDDDKTYGVGFQLAEGMITTSIATQVLKHITGRETPGQATAPRGRWDFFPNQQDYANNVPKYDAFPSGHVAVSTMTLTVLAKNYPDNPWIIPTGVTLISLLSFQMMNNGVHWASDYPLAIALGYVFGNIAYERGQKSVESNAIKDNVQWIPIVLDGGLGVGLLYEF